jgi:hypothetical protein
MDVAKARDALPKKIRDACDEAIREFEAYWAACEAGTVKGYEHTKSNRAYGAMKEALALVNLEREAQGPKLPAIESVNELTADQRNVVAVLSQRPIPLETGWSRIHLAAPRRRRWLGIDPPGVLDEPGPDGRPRYEADDPLEGLPVERHLEAVVEGELGEYPREDTGYADMLDEVVAKHAKHGAAYAARVLPTLKGQSKFVIDRVVTALYLALIRSNTPIPEDADRLLPIARHMQHPTPTEHLIEMVGGLPPGRREAALIAAMKRSDGRSNDVLRGVTAVLAKLPMPTVLDAALAYAKERKVTKDSFVKSELVKLERELKAMLKGGAAPKPAARFELFVESSLNPTSVDELAPIQVKQLAVAGDEWEGTKRPPARRLAVDDNNDDSSFGGVCEWRVLVGDGRRYDAWMFAGDSGAYFVAGTTKRIAEMIQGSISVLAEKDVDTGLVEALSAASSARAKSAPASSKAKPAAKAKASGKTKPAARTKSAAKAKRR